MATWYVQAEWTVGASRQLERLEVQAETKDAVTAQVLRLAQEKGYGTPRVVSATPAPGPAVAAPYARAVPVRLLPRLGGEADGTDEPAAPPEYLRELRDLRSVTGRFVPPQALLLLRSTCLELDLDETARLMDVVLGEMTSGEEMGSMEWWLAQGLTEEQHDQDHHHLRAVVEANGIETVLSHFEDEFWNAGYENEAAMLCAARQALERGSVSAMER